MESRPSVVILAGPNGAGKSTAAPQLLRGPLAVADFVNADDIALERSPSDPARVAVAGGREMLARLHELARQRRSFAFETTLATRHFAGWLEGLKETAYAVHLLFLWVPNPDFARTRVEGRVTLGGHDVVRHRAVAFVAARRRHPLHRRSLGPNVPFLPDVRPVKAARRRPGVVVTAASRRG